MSSLKPCPFCNGTQIKTNEIQHNRGCFMVLQAMPRPDTTSAILWEAWNTRASDATAEKLAGLLKEYCSNAPPGIQERIDAALAAYDAEVKANPSDQRAGASPAPALSPLLDSEPLTEK